MHEEFQNTAGDRKILKRQIHEREKKLRQKVSATEASIALSKLKVEFAPLSGIPITPPGMPFVLAEDTLKAGEDKDTCYFLRRENCL